MFRIGGKVPLSVYEDDRPLFQCHTPEEAARIVRLLNKTVEYEKAIGLLPLELFEKPIDEIDAADFVDSANDFYTAMEAIREVKRS